MTAASNQPARIFVVEDDPVMLRMVGDYLEQHNMQVVSASGRQEMLPSTSLSVSPISSSSTCGWVRKRASTCCGRSGRARTSR